METFQFLSLLQNLVFQNQKLRNMENNIAVALHQEAMDLYDFGKIKKAKGGTEAAYLQNVQKAFILDLEAALLIQNIKGEEIRQSAYPRSAGWLAYKCGKYMEARELAQLGLSHISTISNYEKEKLNDLIKAVDKKLAIIAPLKDNTNAVLAIVSSADIDTEILQIRRLGDKKYQKVKVAADRIIQIARLFIGQTVEIQVKKDPQGQMILQDIRRAA